MSHVFLMSCDIRSLSHVLIFLMSVDDCLASFEISYPSHVFRYSSHVLRYLGNKSCLSPVFRDLISFSCLAIFFSCPSISRQQVMSFSGLSMFLPCRSISHVCRDLSHVCRSFAQVFRHLMSFSCLSFCSHACRYLGNKSCLSPVFRHSSHPVRYLTSIEMFLMSADLFLQSFNISCLSHVFRDSSQVVGHFGNKDATSHIDVTSFDIEPRKTLPPLSISSLPCISRVIMSYFHILGGFT